MWVLHATFTLCHSLLSHPLKPHNHAPKTSHLHLTYCVIVVVDDQKQWL
ncbi:hypothetical protein CsSME_00031513 [Camellia sinensis var. sinensis]